MNQTNALEKYVSNQFKSIRCIRIDIAERNNVLGDVCDAAMRLHFRANDTVDPHGRIENQHFTKGEKQ